MLSKVTDFLMKNNWIITVILLPLILFIYKKLTYVIDRNKTNTKKNWGIPRSAVFGIEFYQDNNKCLVIEEKDELYGHLNIVTLEKQNFEIKIPRQNMIDNIGIFAWYDETIFEIFNDDKPIDLEARGMASGEFGNGELLLSNDGFNYIGGNRFDEINDIYFTKFINRFTDCELAKPTIYLKDLREPMYLCFFIEQKFEDFEEESLEENDYQKSDIVIINNEDVLEEENEVEEDLYEKHYRYEFFKLDFK